MVLGLPLSVQRSSGKPSEDDAPISVDRAICFYGHRCGQESNEATFNGNAEQILCEIRESQFVPHEVDATLVDVKAVDARFETIPGENAGFLPAGSMTIKSNGMHV